MGMEIFVSLILLLVGIAVLVLIHVCIVGRAFRRNNEGGNAEHQNRDGIRTKRMSGDDLENLPCFDYKEAEKGASPVDCAVCLDNFKVGEVCRFLPNCSHSFHVQCIDSWILKTPICPICRTWVHMPVIPTVLNEEIAVSDNAGIEIV